MKLINREPIQNLIVLSINYDSLIFHKIRNDASVVFYNFRVAINLSILIPKLLILFLKLSTLFLQLFIFLRLYFILYRRFVVFLDMTKTHSQIHHIRETRRTIIVNCALKCK